ncbi:MAG: NAD(P)H-dependent oxidoreductase subunit E [Flavobacteriales bacterium]|nr:NAD(P)H-dependent oxidoreductase subunit E [Flavobacteriales bacterium]
MSNNLSELLGRKGVDENLFDKLGRSAQPQGTPDEETLAQLANEFLIGKANTYGTATFYDFLKPENKGKKAYVCNGTACLCAGTQEEVAKRLIDVYGEAAVGHMTCLGRCHENNAFHIDGTNYSVKAIEDLVNISKGDSCSGSDEYNTGAYGAKVLPEPFTDLDTHYRPFLDALNRDSVQVLEEIKNIQRPR